MFLALAADDDPAPLALAWEDLLTLPVAVLDEVFALL